MKFIFADSLDYVDPGYDFIEDRFAPGREAYWDDQFPHEIMGYAPYDGILVSRAIVSSPFGSAKYTKSQAMRLRREGTRAFLRVNKPQFKNLDIFGDCGAFAYAQQKEPPYTPEDMVSFYEDCQFTHGCSVDHIIFDFDPTVRAMKGGSEEARRRFDITLQNAKDFIRLSRPLRNTFTPLGVVQGWSPSSMAKAARSLVAMGYDYLAVGGMVPLKAAQIKQCLAAIREAIPASTRLHILGFAKADEIDSFVPFGITSFDTTSPLIRAFKDKQDNYYLPGEHGQLRTFTAIRVPQALENTRLKNLVKQGRVRAEDLLRLERSALDKLRAFDKRRAGLEDALDAVLDYAAPMEFGIPRAEVERSKKSAEALGQLAARYRETLKSKPWKQCDCSICKQASIEVIIFRASNRNKRRGIHNLGIFKSHVETIGERKACTKKSAQPELFSATS